MPAAPPTRRSPALAVNAGELDVASDDLSLSGDLDNTGRLDTR